MLPLTIGGWSISYQRQKPLHGIHAMYQNMGKSHTHFVQRGNSQDFVQWGVDCNTKFGFESRSTQTMQEKKIMQLHFQLQFEAALRTTARFSDV